MKLYDMHCHLDLMPSMITFADNTEKKGIGIFAVTTTPKAYEKERELLKAFSSVRVGLGLHPQLVSTRYNEIALIEKYIAESTYIGEIGLDFNKQFYSSKDKQTEVFESIIKWCDQYTGKIISIHSVHADKPTLDILEKYACTKRNRCILHWFSGTLRQLQRAIEMGCLFSINGAMFNSTNGQNLIRHIPPANILLESDAPFVDEINTVKRLSDHLLSVRDRLYEQFGADILSCIDQTSAELFRCSGAKQ